MQISPWSAEINRNQKTIAHLPPMPDSAMYVFSLRIFVGVKHCARLAG
jgi:hypothetical protein